MDSASASEGPAAAAGATAPPPPSSAYGQLGPELFDLQAAAYAIYRPVYPKHLYSSIMAFGGEALACRGLALDVATGSGQVAVALSELFAAVVGCDSSEGQLSHAVRRPNIRYVLAPAEELPADPGSVDLVTCAQALHWFDVQRFYNEAGRVLKPAGVLAVWSYGLPVIESPLRNIPYEALAAANSLLEQLYSVTLGQYWDERRALVESGYQGLEPDGAVFTRVERQELTMQAELSVNAAVGYLSSWSAYAKFRRCNPDAEDPLVAFKRQLMETLQLEDDECDGALVLRSAVPLILAQGPVPQS
ncbi:hypothetical protein D9Q98_002390 [Chlorella vulgaris]|uniref:Methyltransferase type 11 domain-containing protein n=1 Tax=Chlorella vulgaris TaxID=3077 RepID=A0A9D4Z179_CHLVU|nr:hypothetical protein D9Q98_002390 [Chlorella vulgaris]